MVQARTAPQQLFPCRRGFELVAAMLCGLFAACRSGAANEGLASVTAGAAVSVAGAGTAAATAGRVGVEPAAAAGASAPTAGRSMLATAGVGSTAGTAATSAGAGGAQIAGPGGGSAAVAGASGVAAGSGGGLGGNGAAAGSGGVPANPDRVPTFQKTRCIDPSKLKLGMEVNFPCDGVDIWVVVPSQCMRKACGLVFNIHGGGMSDHATMDQATNMIALGTQADYIVVHPHKGTWNVAQDKTVVFGFMEQVIQAFDVDKKRVHSTGYSQGGQLSWALGCEHADVVASIAPAEEINRVSDCWKTSQLPSRELSVLFAYGKQDSIGGGYDAATMDASRFASSQQWTGPETIAGSEGSRYWRQRWKGNAGNVLEFISHDYGSTGVGGILAGHCLPMANGMTFVSCSLPVDYDWGKEVIAFFQAHPQP